MNLLIKATSCVTFIVAVLLLIEAQYETPNNLCGGYFRTNRGSIKFRFTSESIGHDNKLCIWTIIPPVPFEYSAYSMNVSTFSFPAVGATLAVNGFKERTSTPQTLSITGASGQFNIDGPLVVIILRVPRVTVNHGFDLHWHESGSQLNVSRLTSTYYSWGQSSVAPLPYFAAHYMRNEISTFAFPKGNSTPEGYVLQMTFDNIRLDKGCSTLPTNPASRISCDFIVLSSIGDNGALSASPTLHSTNKTDVEAERSKNGFYLIVWSSDEQGGGGSFQMRYNTVR